MNRILILLVFVIQIIACKEADNTIKDSKTTNKESIESTEMVETGLQPMDKTEYDKLFANTTFIDYIWHELPFSVSQSEPDAVKANVSFISPNGFARVPKKCKSIGRKSYQFNGDIYLDADIYYGNGCAYYIFLKDNKPVYLNAISENGQKFYGHLFKSAMKTSEKIRNGESIDN